MHYIINIFDKYVLLYLKKKILHEGNKTSVIPIFLCLPEIDLYQ